MTCTYVDMFALSPNTNKQTMTYDSMHNFCDITDIDPGTLCCKEDKKLDIDYDLGCNKNTQCCESMPQCVAHCSLPQIKPDEVTIHREESSQDLHKQIFSDCE